MTIFIPEYIFDLPAEQLAKSLQIRSARAFAEQKRKEKNRRIASTITIVAIVIASIISFAMISPAEEPVYVAQTTMTRNDDVTQHTVMVRGNSPAWAIDIGAQERFAQAVEAVAGNQSYECKMAVASCIRTAAEDYGLTLDDVLHSFRYPTTAGYASAETYQAINAVLSGEKQSPFLTARPVYCYNAVEEPENWVGTQSYVGRIGDLWFYAAPILD